MNRKLHNSLMAVMASSTLFLVGLLVVGPGQSTLAAATPMASVASLEADADDASIDGDGADAMAEASSAPRRHIRARRQSVQMPFFSFVPRG